jgi:2,4-dienoyl-CoA reductase-like NADH-dependent reductase (Old Yellow Enzyme family)
MADPAPSHPSAPDRHQPDLHHLWQPYQLRHLTIKNRIVDPPKTLLYGVDNIISDRHIAFYRERAKGGVAVQVSEQTAAHPIAKGSFYQGITAYEPRVIPHYRTLADTVHEHDCRFFVQLFHPGVHDKGSTIMDEWHPLWAASRVPSNVHHEVPMVMGQAHVDDLARGFGVSALNLKTAGIDGVEVHAAHSYGIAQFMSPYYNKRDDRYGVGTLAGCQLALDVGRAIRRSVGDDFVVGLRMCWDEFLGPAGITPDLAAEQLEILAASGLFDYFSISGAAYPTLHLGTAGMRVPQGYMIEFGRAAKAIAGDRAAVWIVGRIKHLEMAEEIVATGAADAVCMSRAQLADPFLVRKGMEGRLHEANH